MAVSIKITGIKELQNELQKLTFGHEKEVKKIVRHNGMLLQQKMQRNAVFSGPYSVGDTQRSIELDITEAGYAAQVGPTTHYAPYLEYGTRFMDAQPFVNKSLQAQLPKFKADLNRLMK